RNSAICGISARRCIAAKVAEHAVEGTDCAETSSGAVPVDLSEGRKTVQQLPVRTDDRIVRIHVLDPMGGVHPIAVSGFRRDVLVRIVGDDFLPGEVEWRGELTLARNARTP